MPELLANREHPLPTAQVTAHFSGRYGNVDIGDVALVATQTPLRLDCGQEIRHVPIAFQTYGRLNHERSNAILVCHGLTGDQYLADRHPVTGKPGWWHTLVGPGKILDTNRYYIIASNVIGGCMGSFGPKEINPESNRPWALDFPVITIADMVRAQKLLVEALGIDTLFSVIGGSMGGMQVLEWAAQFPNAIRSAVPIATTARHSAQNIAFHEIGRQSVMTDPDWHNGQYHARGTHPARGLSIARMTAHVTYLSDATLHRKFGRNLQEREQISYGFDADFQVESYLRHQGTTFVDRFDANSYLYITRAMDYFDLAERHGNVLANAFSGIRAHFCVVSFSSDWLYPTSENRHIVRALAAAGAPVSFVEVETDKGHDAFLLDVPEFHATLSGFLKGMASRAGLKA